LSLNIDPKMVALPSNWATFPPRPAEVAEPPPVESQEIRGILDQLRVQAKSPTPTRIH